MILDLDYYNVINGNLYYQSLENYKQYRQKFKLPISKLQYFRTIPIFLSPMQKSVIKHSLLEQPFEISMKIRKRLPLQKNIFELSQPQLKKISTPQTPIQQQCHLVDPLVMDSALIKSLLFGKMESYLILLSLLVSCLLVYKYEDHMVEEMNQSQGGKANSYYSVGEDIQSDTIHSLALSPAKNHLLLLQSFISFLLFTTVLSGHYFEQQANTTRGLQTKYFLKLIKLLTFLLHPNIYTPQTNFLLHFAIILRLPFLLSYSIKTTTYHNNRSFRLTEIYGIKPSQNYFFAVKSIVDQMQIQQIVIAYVFIAFLFTHCLYLAGMSQPHQGKSFWSCFEIIIVTLPTIGYGEYNVENLFQRSIILVTLVFGACMNSLITLIMLRQFQMSTQQTFSYNLLHKLNLKQRMEHISREYIVTTVQQLRQNSFHTQKVTRQERKEIDNNFKEEYKYLKTHYTEINTRDLSSMFNLFKEQLKSFRVQSEQMNNLLFVLLTKLHQVKSLRKSSKR